MNVLAKRVTKISAKVEERTGATRSGVLHLVPVYVGETDEQAIANAGITPMPHDLVVLLRAVRPRLESASSAPGICA